jgi:DNA modification methylase
VTVYFHDATLTLLLGDARDQLRTLAAGSINCVVTSPPYYGLRDYASHPAQIGAEPSPEEYAGRLVAVFDEVRRVLVDDGTVWLNLGDSYSSGNPTRNTDFNQRWHGPDCAGQRKQERGRRSHRRDGAQVAAPRRSAVGLPPKNLLGVPWRVAFALQQAGWFVRNAVVWHKPNAMPDPVRDRLTCGYELVFLLAKSPRYHFDLDAIRRPTHANPGDVWEISTTPLPDAHFAAFPPELPRRCIAAGCPPSGTVLDPFSGAGTTAMVAQRLGRRAIGVDLIAAYHDIALRRMATAPLPFDEPPCHPTE